VEKRATRKKKKEKKIVSQRRTEEHQVRIGKGKRRLDGKVERGGVRTASSRWGAPTQQAVPFGKTKQNNIQEEGGEERREKDNGPKADGWGEEKKERGRSSCLRPRRKRGNLSETIRKREKERKKDPRLHGKGEGRKKGKKCTYKTAPPFDGKGEKWAKKQL